jgi:hypothetical protein
MEAAKLLIRVITFILILRLVSLGLFAFARCFHRPSSMMSARSWSVTTPTKG